MIQKQTDQLIPDQYRGTIYSFGGALATLLGVFGWASEEQSAAIGVAVIAVAAAVLAVIHSRKLWRQALYLVLAAGGSILLVWGVGSQEEIGAVLGLAAVVLGTQVAAQTTPEPKNLPARVASHRSGPSSDDLRTE